MFKVALAIASVCLLAGCSPAPNAASSNVDIAKIAGQSATRGAKPLNYNGFKIPLMANLVTRAVRDATA